MSINLNEAINKIKQVGSLNTRIVPMKGQSVVDGDHQIEILESGSWRAIVSGIKRRTAEDIVSQSTSRLILG